MEQELNNGKELKEIKEVKKISNQSFKQKINTAKQIFYANKRKINEKYKKEIKECGTKNGKRKLNEYRKRKLINNKNKYAFKYNTLTNQKLFRRSIFEAKTHEIKIAFRKRKKYSENWDSKKESILLAKELKLLHKKYSKPISTRYILSRNQQLDIDAPKRAIKLSTPLKKNIKAAIFVIFAALVSTIALDVFIKPWGLYNVGLRGITQTFFYLWKSFTPNLDTSISYLIFFVANIPFAIFGWFKLGRRFTIITIIFIVTQYMISLLFSQVTFSGVSLYTHIKPFGHSAAFYMSQPLNSEFDWAHYTLPFISVLIGGIMYGAGAGLIYKAGGSTGGSKFIVTWLSVTKGKSIGFVSLIIALFVVTFGISINKIAIAHINGLEAFTSIIAICSMIFAATSNITLDKVFPKSKKVKISLVTTKKDAIIKYLDVQLLFSRSYTYIKVSAGHSGKQRYEFQFVVSAQEQEILTESFRKIDSRSFISVLNVEKTSGKFYTYWFE